MSIYDAANSSDWHKINQITGWFSQDEAIAMQSLVKGLPPGARVAELGSFQGRSSVVIASVLPPDGILYCVDHFEGSPEHKGGDFKLEYLGVNFINNIKKFQVDDQIRVLIMDTLEASERFVGEFFHLVFIDAAHDYEGVKADILQWYPKIKMKGFLICHDYCTGWQGVIDAISELQLEGNLIAGNLWLHQKNKIIANVVE